MEGNKHELEKITWGVIPITYYRGCLVTKLIGGFEIFGQKVKTANEVDEVIEGAGEHLKNSISVVNNGNFNCTNDKI